MSTFALFALAIAAAPVDVSREEVLEVPIEAVAAALGTPAAHVDIVPFMNTSRAIEGRDDVWYQRLDPPAMAPRDVVARVEQSWSEDEAGRRVHVFRVEDEDDVGPAVPEGVIRAPEVDVTWTLREVDEGRTQVELQLAFDAGGDVPASILDELVERAVPQLFSRLRDKAQRIAWAQ